MHFQIVSCGYRDAMQLVPRSVHLSLTIVHFGYCFCCSFCSVKCVPISDYGVGDWAILLSVVLLRWTLGGFSS